MFNHAALKVEWAEKGGNAVQGGISGTDRTIYFIIILPQTAGHGVNLRDPVTSWSYDLGHYLVC